MSKSTRPDALDNYTAIERPRVVVRFREGVRLPSEPEMHIEKMQVGPWGKLTQEFPNLHLSPVFTTPKSESHDAMLRRAQESDPAYKPADFSTFYYVDSPVGTDLIALAKSLLTWHSVQEAYIDQAGPDPVVNAADDPRAVNQGYLDAAPDGINARYAWTFPGGDGAGQSLIDMERGWTLNHEDITAHGATLLHGVLLDSSRDHGTSVLGEVCAVDNTVGCVGIAPNLTSVHVVSYNGSSRPNAIMAAIAAMNFGDVLLLEAQVTLNGTTLLGPVEWYDAEYEAIRLATALGIIVVEAGGNGTNNGSTPPLNMDTFTTLSGKAILNRDPANPDFRDSGALIVSAATAVAPHTRLTWAPHGRRIDCYAWGESINTLASNDTGATSLYTTIFGGTSGASPIITGAALAVQGRAQAQIGHRFSPRQMRAILSDPAINTLPSPMETTRMGVMPNLRGIFDNVLNTAPDVYLRDFVGDAGEPHTGAISASPDIITRPLAVTNPQASFGAGSGTENDATLGFIVEAGQNNFIYVRVLNQGGTAATNVDATIYWSPPATLVTPLLWHLIGTVTLPNVPIGEQLTVSDALIWHSADIPATGHYCYVGLIGNAQDPAPGLAEFNDWNNFMRFIRENNNVTWRNFNVEDNDPSVNDPTVPKGYKALKFLAPGAMDIARPMALEINARLPEGARALLEVPIVFYELLHERHQLAPAERDTKRGIARIRLNPQGKNDLGEILFPAKSENPMRLLIQIPEKHRRGAYRVWARQLWEGQEVGRITWLLQPKRPVPKASY